jgi:hypothetical protein
MKTPAEFIKTHLGAEIRYKNSTDIVGTIVAVARRHNFIKPLNLIVEYPKGSCVVWEDFGLCSMQAGKDSNWLAHGHIFYYENSSPIRGFNPLKLWHIPTVDGTSPSLHELNAVYGKGYDYNRMIPAKVQNVDELSRLKKRKKSFDNPYHLPNADFTNILTEYFHCPESK